MRRLTTILRVMPLTEALATTRIHRVAGLTGARTAVVTTRPFRAPHDTISEPVPTIAVRPPPPFTSVPASPDAFHLTPGQH